MMTCREVNLLLKPYLHGDLPFTERIEFHRHLALCAGCARSVEQARDALDLSRSACASAQDPVPDDVPEALVRAILVTSRCQV